MNVSALCTAISAVCPIDGVSGDGTIWFKAEATQQQKDAANAVVASWVDPFDSLQIKNECLKRIRAVVDLETQTNLMAFSMANILNATEKSQLASGAQWLKDMRAAARTMIVNKQLNNALWPAVPSNFLTLVSNYSVNGS